MDPMRSQSSEKVRAETETVHISNWRGLSTHTAGPGAPGAPISPSLPGAPYKTHTETNIAS